MSVLLGDAARVLPRRPSRLARSFKGRSAILFLLPSGLILGVFVVYPIFSSAWMSLHNWSYLQKDHQFIGLGNYLAIAGDARFWNALLNTAIFSAVTVPLQIIIGLALALKLQRSGIASSFFRSAFFFPVVSAFAIMAIVWKFMLSPDVGPFAGWARDLGLPVTGVLQSTELALPAVILVGLWKNIGFTMVILIAALQDVPESLNEAAVLDGAGAWGRFRHVTLPAIRQPMLFATIIAVIASLQVFDQVYVMTGGGPIFHTETLVTYIYQLGFQQYQSGYAAAVSWVLFLLIMLVSVLQLRIFRYQDVD
jgi:ABC-type sugar transport system permease subunit